MGHSAKKKKRGGGSGKRTKGRTPLKDHASHESADDNELLSEEITALCAIFQEDCKFLPGPPPQVFIKLRPYSKDMGFEDVDVSAVLLVRCLPGYPYKCPKLQITPEKGLSENDADKLLSLLHDQANSNAREGRVMIFNLVEAAQEFLSEIVPVGQSQELVLSSSMDSGSKLLYQDNAISTSNLGGPFVYGFVDLFSGSGESWNWGFGLDENSVIKTSVPARTVDGPKTKNKVEEKHLQNYVGPLVFQETRKDSLLSPMTKLRTLEEESEEGDKNLSSSNSSTSSVEKSVGNSSTGGEEDFSLVEHIEEDDKGSECSNSLSSASLSHERVPQTSQKDLIMVHLLRLACTSNVALSNAMQQISTELYNLGIFSEQAKELASEASTVFNRTFDNAFRQYMVSSKLSEFWKYTSDIEGPRTSLPNSRYLNDFEELQSLGHGGFGHVVLCKNKIDGRQYAVKKIRLKDKSLPLNDRILREVATLSRLQHQHVVRYYQAWFETGISGSYGDAIWGSRTAGGSNFSFTGTSSADTIGQDNKLESTYLYIQMEYCPRTLRQVFDPYSHFDKELAWHFFRQIVEGLAHIHGQGIIHRDLTPNNIFFDARNDIKIGDFGLAKFLKLEQLEQDLSYPAETTGVSVDGTGQVGTYFYTAPEIEQGWPKIDEKADMYSLGIVFFELWHPFGTAMERHVVLSDLKQKGELPSAWVAEFPEQASLLRRLMSPSPSDRPSAAELLHHAFPPRMESELLDNILRTMQTSEDSNIYDKVVNAIFDEEVLSIKDQHNHTGRFRLPGGGTSAIQYAELDTEIRDYVTEISNEVFRKHCARHLEIISMRLSDDCPQFNRNTVKLLSHGGDMLELCHELRLPFVSWVIYSQKSSFKRFEISCVYRRAIGHSPPNRYLQGDFDIIGGASAITEAEIIKVTMDILIHFLNPHCCELHLNHGNLLESIWSWTGVKAEHRHKVAELLSMMDSLRPQSTERKSKWVVIRRQLLQELNLPEAVVNRLQTVGLRFCGPADQALPRLRGALPSDKATRKALDELSDLCSYLRVWRIERHVYIDPLMPPTEIYHRELFFQVYLMKENLSGTLVDGILLAIGGRYDYLLHQMWVQEHKSHAPGGVGTSLALETIIQHSLVDLKPIRNDDSVSILVCSRGGGGLLEEWMELVAELWEENIKAEFVPKPDPSLTEQYEYASEHDIKCLVIIRDTGVAHMGSVKVRHLEIKKEKEVERENLVKFLLDAMAVQFRNPSIWN
ncbi:eIF-2-alpha kinase GCN2 isoform X2 [Morus notabilis]|uniref:eIF-2-alpha kinase GCN2 isoform X2 n=1 Tax=Morus notabilis TaxID=981085 RepID=UPI000CED22CF|nr:eIF-2-alpha kinase GCN2 isoform X2 [Morus notabilis]